MNNVKQRNSLIEVLRFVFCIVIVNYHFHSHFLLYSDYPHYFARGYTGDEFFFVISGMFLAQAAVGTDKSPIKFMLDSMKNRFKKRVVPYYLTWCLCFIGRELQKKVMDGNSIRLVLEDLANSIYELLFLDMFGFKKGTYSNPLAWFFSALMICTFLLSPLIVKYKNAYTLYLAPTLALFGYGFLSLEFDYLHSPHACILGGTCLKVLCGPLRG